MPTTKSTAPKKREAKLCRSAEDVRFEMPFVRCLRGFDRDSAAIVAKYRVRVK